MKKIISLCLFLLLFGCGKKVEIAPGQNIIALADEQRHAVMTTTRAGSYVVYPDMPDPSITADKGFFEAAKAERLLGTAFGVNEKGLVFTAAHVITHTNFCTAPGHPDGVARQAKKQATYCSLITQTYKKVFRAKVVVLDEVNDVALLQIEHAPETLPFLKLAETGSFDDGGEVLTVGAPLGNANFTTIGYISNLDFVKPSGDEPTKIQFLATMQPGNSGGPLVGVKSGEVVGLVIEIFAIQAMTPGGLAPISTGMSYATPVEVLRLILKKHTS